MTGLQLAGAAADLVAPGAQLAGRAAIVTGTRSQAAVPELTRAPTGLTATEAELDGVAADMSEATGDPPPVTRGDRTSAEAEDANLNSRSPGTPLSMLPSYRAGDIQVDKIVVRSVWQSNAYSPPHGQGAVTFGKVLVLCSQYNLPPFEGGFKLCKKKMKDIVKGFLDEYEERCRSSTPGDDPDLERMLDDILHPPETPNEKDVARKAQARALADLIINRAKGGHGGDGEVDDSGAAAADIRIPRPWEGDSDAAMTSFVEQQAEAAAKQLELQSQQLEEEKAARVATTARRDRELHLQEDRLRFEREQFEAHRETERARVDADAEQRRQFLEMMTSIVGVVAWIKAASSSSSSP